MENPTQSERTRRASKRNIRLGSLGAALEYYDFVVYLYVATLIGQAFFPADTSEAARLIQTLSIYAIGMVIRPFAGVLIARSADRVGRKKMFIFTVALMSLSTLVIGLSPTFQQIGWFAPALLILMRALQGCAVGGELPGAAVFVTEHAGRDRVARAGAFQQMTAYTGFLLGATAAFLAGIITTQVFPGMPSLAWRLPFIVGGVLGLITIYLRRNLDETPSFVHESERRNQRTAAPVKEVLRDFRRPLLFSTLVVLPLALANGTYFQFWPTYLQATLGLPANVALSATLISIAVAMLSMPLWGFVADKYGWSVELALAALLTTIATIFLLLAQPMVTQQPSLAFWIQAPAAFAIGGIVAAVPGLVSSSFPTEVRQTGYALTYNVVVAVVGGPFIVMLAWLVATFGPSAPMFVVLAAGGLTFVAAILVRGVRLYLGSNSEAQPANDSTSASRSHDTKRSEVSN